MPVIERVITKILHILIYTFVSSHNNNFRPKPRQDARLLGQIFRVVMCRYHIEMDLNVVFLDFTEFGTNCSSRCFVNTVNV